ncbi:MULTISPECIES: diaminobutyrate--2-oxoglutarate transaminase [unclassified Arthrobacter]|uniref:diaminobutyrate--2-oxoglutarate transaminase n=1 Tax=unclassified Arthrobacter TaxID=235627 RepID=UPI002E074005|nr:MULTISPECIES: diaminobutyrate--2-oxoglutarate transaminase [unclassified Arthrobacter]MEC5192998.1 diaminobutyrate-2-oxoglutarate transaminase [Arthrobacter sp. MP_M4]MEC5204494.1 diaminobutyrate-2-oxoglutarate transaminase [Arthrobacter sp. MP_M7]
MDIFDVLESEVRTYCRSWDTVFDRASGSTLYSEDGRDYLDFFSGAGALNYGHNNPELLRPLVEYLLSGAIVHSLDMKTVAKRRFLETFNELILKPRNYDYKVMFPGPTGTNAVEAALKLARKVTGRTQILSFTNAFHGMTLGSLAVTGNSMKRQGAGVPLLNTTSMPYDGFLDNQAAESSWLRQALEDSGSGLDKPAAVIVETVQGEGGLRAARASWLRELAELCRQHGILLIVDDVQAGCGRTGTFFSFEDSGIIPDIVCLSKSISGFGLPLSLTLFKPEHDIWKPGEHNGTFRGHNPAFVTGTAALERFWAGRSFESKIAGLTSQLHEGLSQIAAGTEGARVRGRGLLAGIYYPDHEVAGKIAAESFARGLLVETSGPESEVLKTMPALTIGADELMRGLDILADAAEFVTGGRVAVKSIA